MPNLTDVNHQFRQLHDEAVRAYEEKRVSQQKKQERIGQLQQRRQEHISTMIHALQLDEHTFERIAHEEAIALQNHLREVRPSLAKRTISGAEDTKQLALSPLFQIPNQKIVPIYAATLLASDPTNLMGNPGEHGNPWILPDNPGQVKIRAYDAGAGWGCAAHPEPSPPTNDASATFWYYFVPDNYGIWNLTAFTTFHGFLILKARSDLFSCEEITMAIIATMNVYQDGIWHTPVDTSLAYDDAGGFDKGSIDDTLRYDTAESFDYRIALAQGDPVWITLTINLHTHAQGGGSYSEINFSEETGNFIQPGIVAAFRSG